MHVFVDTETTGFARGGVQPRIVSVAWILAADAAGLGAPTYRVVRPEGFAIPAGATAVHGISTGQALREGRPLGAVLAEFAAALRAAEARTLVAHNLAYDRPVLAAEYDRVGRPDPCAALDGACTMLAARRRWPGESARLGEVHRRLFGERLEGAHHAGSDVLACARIFFALREAAGAAPEPPTAGAEPDWPDLVAAVLRWAARRTGFDAGFVEGLRERLDSGRTLTGAQQAALRRLIAGWRIPV